MNDTIAGIGGCLLWAETPFETMGSHFRGETATLYMDDLLICVLVIVGVVVAAGILYWLFTGTERVHRHYHPKALFRSLCRAHGIRFRDRLLLAQLARHHGLEHPARLFLEAERFAPTTLSPRLHRNLDALSALRAILFTEPPGAAAHSTLAGYAVGIDLPAEGAAAGR